MGSIFEGIYNNGTVSTISVPVFLACIAVSLLIGAFLAVVAMQENHYTTSFVITLAFLPAIVCVVILMVNGNVGAGVAVAGTFSLVRFRSVPGTAKEIGLIFLAMSAGLVAGMGYLGYAVTFALIMGLLMMFYHKINLGGKNFAERDKILRITIPEDLDYSGIFDDLFEKYTEKKEVISVKTTNMGSMFKLTYHITLKDITQEKAFMDELRCRNGNLEIALSKQEESGNEL